jgi:hypothetical protein
MKILKVIFRGSAVRIGAASARGGQRVGDSRLVSEPEVKRLVSEPEVKRPVNEPR